ncbi:MAG: GTPase ObgE [Patescibacteria group bacterium]
MINSATITVEGGKGGNGAVSFHREKFRPRGGPDGGKGGRGGNVYFLTDNNISTLSKFKRQKHFQAEKGNAGGPNHKKGKNGEDLVIRIPCGTELWEKRNNKDIFLVDLLENNSRYLVARGGKGGRGNAALRTSENKLPREAEKGQKGEKRIIRLELKMIADVGIIGLPNAGKSTFLKQITSAQPKIGDYPFTTLEPNLGVTLVQKKRIIFADIPGLIRGAAKGKGLGDEFLRHIERTRILLHIIDPYSAKIMLEDNENLTDAALSAYDVIRKELDQYSPTLKEKPEIVAINKTDLPEISQEEEQLAKSFENKKGIKPVFISGATGQGIDKLLNKFPTKTTAIEKQEKRENQMGIKVYGIRDLPNQRIVFEKEQPRLKHR